MSEYYDAGSNETSEDDDDDEEVVSESKSTIDAKPLGELLVQHDTEQEKGKESRPFWRQDPEAKTPSLLSSAEESTDEPEHPTDEKPLLPTAEAIQDSDIESSDTDTEEGEELPLDLLTSGEEHLVYEAERAERGDKKRNDSTDRPESLETAASEDASDKYFDTLGEKLAEDPAKPLKEAATEAASETAAEINAAANELAAAEATEATADADSPAEAATEPEASETEVEPAPTVELPEVVPEAAADIEADADDDPLASTTTAAPTPSAAGGGSSSTFSGPGRTPPPPPYRTYSYYGGSGGAGGPSFGVAPSSSPNTLSNPANITPEELAEQVRNGENRGLVIGGLIGYLVGRRRGRIKTEKRLVPVQQKLERQVKDLRETITRNDREVRDLAAEKVRSAATQAERERMVEQLRSQSKETTILPIIERRREATPNRQPTLPEIQAARPAEATRVAEMFNNSETAPPLRHIQNVERMTNQELLASSEKVLIDGATSLRTIYEAKQITESGLRHIVTEYFSGGDIKKALDQELLVKQLTYERDPRMRDSLSAGYGSSSVGNQGASTAGQTQQATVQGVQPVVQPVGPPTPSAPPSQADIPNEVQSSAGRLERTIVAGWVTVVIILAVVAVVLIMKKG